MFWTYRSTYSTTIILGQWFLTLMTDYNQIGSQDLRGGNRASIFLQSTLPTLSPPSTPLQPDGPNVPSVEKLDQCFQMFKYSPVYTKFIK